MLLIDKITGDFTIGQGNRETAVFTIRDQDGAVVPVQLNTFKLTVKKNIDDDIAEAKFQITAFDMTDAAVGKVRATFLNAHTAALSGAHVMDVEMTEPGSEPQTVYGPKGPVRFTVRKIVTTAGVAPPAPGIVVDFGIGIAVEAIYLRDQGTGQFIKLTNDGGFPDWGPSDPGPPPY